MAHWRREPTGPLLAATNAVISVRTFFAVGQNHGQQSVGPAVLNILIFAEFDKL